MHTINVAEAKSHLSELLSRVSQGERFLIQRRERPLAVLIGSADLERLERTYQIVHRLAAILGQDDTLLAAIEQGDVHPAMAAFGLWHDDPSLADLEERLAADRQNQPSRPLPEV